MYKILIVDKKTKFDSLTEEDLSTLSPEHRSKIKRVDFDHKQAVHMFKQDLLHNPLLYINKEKGKVKCEYTFLNMSEVDPEMDFDQFDAFVSIGGDGTALFLAKFIKNQPLVAINSDPETSVGHICKHQVNKNFNDSWDFLHYQLSNSIRHVNGLFKCDAIPRLMLSIDNKIMGTFLNDALFTNENPAEMSVYEISVLKKLEIQYSSGLWISTAMGSTGAIKSSGVTPVDKKEKVLLWKTREPFEGHSRCWYPHGHMWTDDGDFLNIQARCKGMYFYLDGSFNKIPLEIGKTATIMSAQSLNLI